MRLRTVGKAAVVVIGAPLGLAAVAVVGLVVALEAGWLDRTIENRLSAALGCEVQLTGGIDVGWRGGLLLALGAIEIANPPDWPGGGVMARIARIEATASPGQLLAGRIVLPRVTIRKPDAALHRLPDGRANWMLGTATPAPRPEDAKPGPPFTPRIEALEITDTALAVRDDQGGIGGTLQLPSLAGRGGGDLVVELAGEGSLRVEPQPGAPGAAAGPTPVEAPVRVKLATGAIDNLRRRWPIALDLTVGATRLAAEGALVQLDPVVTAEGTASLTPGGDAAALLRALGGSIPDVPADARLQIGLRAEDGGTQVVIELGAVGETGRVETLVADLADPLAKFAGTIRARGTGLAKLLALGGVGVQGELPEYEIDAAIAREGEAWRADRLLLRLGENRIEGKGRIADAAALDGIELDLRIDAPRLTALTRSLGLTEEVIPDAALNAQIGRDGERTVARVKGTLGRDRVDLDGSAAGPLTAPRELALKAVAEGTTLGRLLPRLGALERPVPHYRLRADASMVPGGAATVDVDAALVGHEIQVKGTIADTASFGGYDLKLAIKGQNPADLMGLFALPEIELPPYSVAGQVSREGTVIKVAGLSGRVGDSDITGDAAVDIGTEPASVTAELASKRLDFDDLAGLVGLPPSTEPGETASPEQRREAAAYQGSDRFLPDIAFDAKAWANLDLDVRYAGTSVDAPSLPLSNLAFHVVVKDKKLSLDPLRTDIAKGTLDARVVIDGAKVPIADDIDIKLSRLELKEFLREFDRQELAFGRISGRIDLTGTGGSLRDIAATSDGRVVLLMEGGEFASIVTEAAGLDIGEIIGALVNDDPNDPNDQRVPVRCLVADFLAKKGMLEVQTFLLDAPNDKFTVEGTIDLRQEELDLMLRAFPRDASFASARMPISIEGKIREPNISPAPGGIENRTLGWVLAPLAALLPFVDVGADDDRPCAGVEQRVRDAVGRR